MLGVGRISSTARVPAIRGGHGKVCGFTAGCGRRKPRPAARTRPALRRARRCGRPSRSSRARSRAAARRRRSLRTSSGLPFTASIRSTRRGAIRGTRSASDRRRRAVREHGDRRGLGEHPAEPALDAAELGVVEVLGERALPGALGDDRAQRARVRGGLEQQLAADREPEPADPGRVDVRLPAQERRSRHAGRARPPSRTRCSRPRSRLRRGGRAAARRSRGGSACARAAPAASGRGRR